MCSINVFIIMCVFRYVLCCEELGDPIQLLYRDGDILDFEITYMTRDPYFPVTNSKTFEFNGQVCNTSTIFPLAVTHMTVDNRFWKFMTVYQKIDKNICSFYTSVLEPNVQRQMQLFELEYDVDRSPENLTPKTFHYKIAVNCVRFCFDVQELIEVVERVSEPDEVVIEGEVGSEIEHICTPDNFNVPSMIQFLSNNSAIIAAFADRTGVPKHLKMKLHEFDNNTQISCASRPAVNQYPKAKFATIKMKPRAVATDDPSDMEVYKYRVNETYDYECSSNNYVVYIMKLNDNNEILSAISSNEYSNKLVNRLILTKNDNNTKLICMTYNCESNRTAKFYECTRRQIRAVKFEMEDSNTPSSAGQKDIVPSDKCQLPAYPPNARYQVINTPNANPFQISDIWILDIICDLGFGILDGANRVHCSSGVWSRKLPQCIPFCKLNQHPSVTYNCRMGDNGTAFTRTCNEYEPPGMLAIAECKKPEYVSNEELPTMHCSTEGMWSDSPTCTPACGEFTPRGIVLINNGEYANLGELPWHVGIYKKTSRPYEQVCGGSIVRPSVVISAAHCFWSNNLPADKKLRPGCDYAVAAGKLYRPWDDPVDNKYAQKINVRSISVPSRFRGASNSFMDDLAVLVLCKPFEYKPHIAPVCLSFNEHFDRIQVTKGVMGKVTGWGVAEAGGTLSPELKVVDLPIVPYLECYNTSPLSFRRFITKDKICAGYKDKGTGVCSGDSGGGLVVANVEQGVTRYYLRGIVSAAPEELVQCSANDVTAFTHVTKHYRFIKPYLSL